jgi:hypothetical protein
MTYLCLSVLKLLSLISFLQELYNIADELCLQVADMDGIINHLNVGGNLITKGHGEYQVQTIQSGSNSTRTIIPRKPARYALLDRDKLEKLFHNFQVKCLQKTCQFHHTGFTIQEWHQAFTVCFICPEGHLTRLWQIFNHHIYACKFIILISWGFESS